jgi:hypothetical protein
MITLAETFSGETIRDQAERFGRQAAELERAASIAVQLSDGLELVKAENHALPARTGTWPAEPALLSAVISLAGPVAVMEDHPFARSAVMSLYHRRPGCPTRPLSAHRCD